MKHALIWLGVSAAIAAVPAAALADAALRGVMHSWRSDAHAVQAMLSGQTAFNEAAIRHALQTYAADAGQIQTRIAASNAAARAFRRRMAGFQADARTAMADMPRHAALRADIVRIMSDCRSCHEIFKN